jgi:hypothetical protein
MVAPRPAARPSHAFLELLLRSANAPLAGLLLLRILDPADELVARERSDVVPRVERRAIGDERLPQIVRELVHDATRDSLSFHAINVA